MQPERATKHTSKRARNAAAARVAPTIQPREAARAAEEASGGGGGVSSTKIAADMAKLATQRQTETINDSDYRTRIDTLRDLRMRAIPEPDYEDEMRELILTEYVNNAPSGSSCFPKETQDRVSDLDHKYPGMREFSKNLIEENDITNPDTDRPYRLTEILEKYLPIHKANMAYIRSLGDGSSSSAAAPERLEPFKNQNAYLLHLLTVAASSVTEQLKNVGDIGTAEAAVKCSTKGYNIMQVINRLPEHDGDLETKRRKCIKSAMILRVLSDEHSDGNTQITNSTKGIMELCEATPILEYYNTM